MKQIYLSLLILLFTLQFAIAQQAPDFTITDIHGEEHSLYADYLDQGKTVVLDLFFVDCPPCNALMPFLTESYAKWGSGSADVEFISLTGDPYNTDDNPYVQAFEDMHGTSWPTASNEGNGPQSQQTYADGDFGPFYGYPTLVVIAPDGSVQFDAYDSSSWEATIAILEEWIMNTGAELPTVNNDDLSPIVQDIQLYPNPTSDVSFLSFNLDKSDLLNISILDLSGREVETLENKNFSAGAHELQISVRDLASGHYILQINSDDQKQSLKLQVID